MWILVCTKFSLFIIYFIRFPILFLSHNVCPLHFFFSFSRSPPFNLILKKKISALATTTGTGINSELVLRPTSNDHGQIFRCHVVHPSLEKPYEVFFTLHVICKLMFKRIFFSFVSCSFSISIYLFYLSTFYLFNKQKH